MNIPAFVKVGNALRLDYGDGNPSNALYHVRALVDGRAVMRHWRKSKQRWQYVVEGPEWFHVNADKLAQAGRSS